MNACFFLGGGGGCGFLFVSGGGGGICHFDFGYDSGNQVQKSPRNHMNGQTEKTLFSRKDNLYFLFDYSEIFVDCILIVYLNALCCKKYNYEINEWRNRISIWWCSANSAIKMTCIHISRIVDIGKLENGCISISFFNSSITGNSLKSCRVFFFFGRGVIWFFGVYF